MNFADSIRDDMDVVDALDTVTLYAVNPQTGAVNDTSPNVVVLHRVEENQEMQVGEATVQVNTCRFHLQAVTCNFVPKERYQILDSDGVTWVIGRVNRAGLSTRYACETVKLTG